jgi:hypothetical protein
MNDIQEEALLKAYVWLGYNGSTDSYYKKPIQTAKGNKFLHVNFTLRHAKAPVLVALVLFNGKSEITAYPFPITSKTTAVETFLMAINVLMQAEKDLDNNA